MLVLTRKFQESIRIGDNVTITILRVKGNTVRVGIDAPRNVRVVRGELPLHGESSTHGTPSAAGSQHVVPSPGGPTTSATEESDESLVSTYVMT